MSEPITPKPKLDTSATRRTPPAAVWFAAGVIAFAALITVITAHQRHLPVALAAAVANLILLAGLLRGQKWAYVLAIVGAVTGVAVAFSKSASHGLILLLGNAVVLVPVLMSTSYFFPEKKPTDSSREPQLPRNQQQGNVV